MKRPLLSLKGQGLALLSRRDHSRAELRAKLLAHARKRALAEAESARRQAARGSGDFMLAFLRPDADVEAAAGAGPAADAVDLADAAGWASKPSETETSETNETNETSETTETTDPSAEVDAVLDWLESQKYLSDARFVESRVNARASRHGQSRIKQELSRLGVAMDAETAQQLRSTEFERAREVWRRKFGELAADAAGKARQARFLAARGFAADVVWRVVGGREPD